MTKALRSSVSEYVSSTSRKMRYTYRAQVTPFVSFTEFVTSLYTAIPGTITNFATGAPKGSGTNWALTIGGWTGSSVTNITNRFNGTVDNTWTQVANAPTSIRVQSPYSTLDKVGQITGTVSGGFSPNGHHSIYDNENNSWSVLASLPASRMTSPCAAEENGNLRAVGGANAPYNHYYYTASTNTFQSLTAPSWQAGNVVHGDSGSVAGIVNNKNFVVYVRGGLESVFYYDADAASWRIVAGNILGSSDSSAPSQYGSSEINGITYLLLRPSLSPNLHIFAFTEGGGIFLAGYSKISAQGENIFGGTNYSSNSMITPYLNRRIAIFTPK